MDRHRPLRPPRNALCILGLIGPAILLVVCLLPRPLEAASSRAATVAFPDSTMQQLAEAVLPDSVGGLSRTSVSVRGPAPSETFVREISATYDTGPAMPYNVTVTYYEPDDPGLARLHKSQAQSQPSLRIQGHPVFERAYGRVGSGVTVFLEGPSSGALYAVVQVRSPRLIAEARQEIGPEQRSDAPAPEAALVEMNLSRVAALGIKFE